jgi:hypothetical protein
MFEGENLTTHVNRICNFINELAITNIFINDNDVVPKLLGSMPEFYANIIIVQMGT